LAFAADLLASADALNWIDASQVGAAGSGAVGFIVVRTSAGTERLLRFAEGERGQEVKELEARELCALAAGHPGLVGAIAACAPEARLGGGPR
jgi:hypothetical protein